MQAQLNKETASFMQEIGLTIVAVVADLLASDYSGLTLQYGQGTLKYRKAKVTPKKVGLFVTLWKRDRENISIPYHTKDDFNCCIIQAEYQERVGFFFFPKDLLIKNGIISTDLKEGKRGFRLYPSWDMPASAQAKKTQAWQSPYFIELTNPQEDKHSKINFFIKQLK